MDELISKVRRLDTSIADLKNQREVLIKQITSSGVNLCSNCMRNGKFTTIPKSQHNCYNCIEDMRG